MRSFLLWSLAALWASSVNAWLAPIIVKDYKLFDSETEVELRVKGMAYYPRANGGELKGVTGFDYAADDHEDIWKPHLKIMSELGVNVVRLYSVDPSKSHDNFMCEASKYGMYVLVGMSAPCENCAILDAAPPACYPEELFTRAQAIYNAFAVYDNTLGFSIANEINLLKGVTVTSPCAKALIRDIKEYAATKCGTMLRQVPIGLDLADTLPRGQWLNYFDCAIDQDENTRADWIGFNQYTECDPLTHTTYAQSAGLQKLMKEYSATGYSRVIMFGEFGCNLGKNTVEGYPNQRTFHDAKWMNEEPEMMDVVVGGNAFEFSTEIANLKSKALSTEVDPGRYGVGYFEPDTCDQKTVLCEYKPYPEFENLKEAYTTTKNSTLKMSEFTPTRTKTLECPAGGNFSTELPPTPKVEKLECSVAQPKCDGKLSNDFKKSPPPSANKTLSSTDSSSSGATSKGNKKTKPDKSTNSQAVSFAMSSFAFSATQWTTVLGLASAVWMWW